MIDPLIGDPYYLAWSSLSFNRHYATTESEGTRSDDSGMATAHAINNATQGMNVRVSTFMPTAAVIVNTAINAKATRSLKFAAVF